MEGQLGHQEPVRQLRRWLAPALVALALAAGAPAHAADPLPTPSSNPSDADKARAKELFENGQTLYEEGRYEDAITAWTESYRLTGYPDLLYNISSAYEKLGDYKGALDTLNKYRIYAKESERETLDRRIRSLEEREAAKEEADKAAAQQAQTTTTPTGTTGTTGATTPTGTTSTGTTSSGTASTGTTGTTTTPATSSGGHVRPLPIALVGVGVVGLGAGAVFGLQAGGALSDVQSQCVPGASGGYLCPDTASGAVDQHDRSAKMSAVSLGAGGVLAGVGLVVGLVGGGSSDVLVAPEVGADGGGLRVDGRF